MTQPPENHQQPGGQFNAQPGQTNAETRASTTTTAAATTAAISLPWEEEVCVLDIRLILSQP